MCCDCYKNWTLDSKTVPPQQQLTCLSAHKTKRHYFQVNDVVVSLLWDFYFNQNCSGYSVNQILFIMIFIDLSSMIKPQRRSPQFQSFNRYSKKMLL